jgi:hypothetical protein
MSDKYLLVKKVTVSYLNTRMRLVITCPIAILYTSTTRLFVSDRFTLRIAAVSRDTSVFRVRIPWRASNTFR